jgi:hypothetical protein
MKRLRGTIQAMGHRIVHLIDPEAVGLLRFQETGESPRGNGLHRAVERSMAR